MASEAADTTADAKAGAGEPQEGLPLESGAGAPSGRELLRRFHRRRELGLLPGPTAASLSSASGLPGPALAVSAERSAALVAHSAYGYGQCSPADVVAAGAAAAGSTDAPEREDAEEAEAGEGGVSLVELEARMAALAAQVAEVEVDLAACRGGAAELGRSVAGRQEEMGRTVDEHAALSRTLAEAQARHGEVTLESDRLQAASALVRVRTAPAEEGDQEEREEESKLEALARARARAAAEKKLALHRTHLVRLDEENRELRQRCEAFAKGAK